MQDHQFQDFRALIAQWPTAAAFARDVAGADYAEHGKIWKRRNRVPRDHHVAVIRACQARGLKGVDQSTLNRLFAAGKGEGR